MKKRFSSLSLMALTILTLAITLVIFPVGSAFAQIADGTYQVSYEMKEAGSNSTSIADGYFAKPATLTVKDGVQHIQMTVTSSDYVRSISGNGATKVSEDAANQTVTYRMQVGDLSQPITMGMHIVLPEDIMPGGYDRQHTARAVFNISGLPQAGAPAQSSDNTSATGEEVVNPPTGDSTPVALYVTLLLASITIFGVYRLRVARN